MLPRPEGRPSAAEGIGAVAYLLCFSASAFFSPRLYVYRTALSAPLVPHALPHPISCPYIPSCTFIYLYLFHLPAFFSVTFLHPVLHPSPWYISRKGSHIRVTGSCRLARKHGPELHFPSSVPFSPRDLFLLSRRWKQQVPTKRWYPSARLHGITSSVP
jgi:hypothetical protein